jgi:hypothetical protein
VVGQFKEIFSKNHLVKFDDGGQVMAKAHMVLEKKTAARN